MKETFKINRENALILILAGVLCLVVVWPESKTESNDVFETNQNSSDVSQNSIDADNSLDRYIHNQENRLKNILSQIEGAGSVQVMIRASASKEYIVEKDLTTNSSTVYETDSEGGTRQSDELARTETSLYTKDSYGNDVPWVIKEVEPEIEGVLVAASGGDQQRVAEEITQAVQVLFDIPAHKIKVVKMKEQ